MRKRRPEPSLCCRHTVPEEAEMPLGAGAGDGDLGMFCTVILVSEEEVLFMMPAYVAVTSSALASMRMLPWNFRCRQRRIRRFPPDGQKRQGRISLSHGDGRIISVSVAWDGFRCCQW